MAYSTRPNTITTEDLVRTHHAAKKPAFDTTKATGAAATAVTTLAHKSGARASGSCSWVASLQVGLLILLALHIV